MKLPGIDERPAAAGGEPVRREGMPARHAIGAAERAMVNLVLDYYNERGLDPGYQGYFEEQYCALFVEMMGGGYADAVATGTASLYIALAALNLPAGSEVLVSPITDPGSLSAIILNGLAPRLIDSQPHSYNVSLAEIEPRVTSNVSCIFIVHSIGKAVDIEPITVFAKSRGIRVLEDCSQSHGALRNGKRIGTFGDIAGFSTMYRKASICGSSGGIVFSRNQDLYHQALAHADRGKPRWKTDFDDRDPSSYLFPALNLHTDEISCGIGTASLRRLDETRAKRMDFVREVSRLLREHSAICTPYEMTEDDSPFVFPIHVRPGALKVSKIEFAEMVRAEGIPLSTHYQYLVRDWPWIQKHLADSFETASARRMLNESFNLYLNEHYTVREAEDVARAILKVENYVRATGPQESR